MKQRTRIIKVPAHMIHEEKIEKWIDRNAGNNWHLDSTFGTSHFVCFIFIHYQEIDLSEELNLFDEAYWKGV